MNRPTEDALSELTEKENPVIARAYITNYQINPLQTATAVPAVQSSWLVKREDIEYLTSVRGYDHIHIFLGRTDPAVPENITLVLVPVVNGANVPYTVGGSTWVSEMVIPCPECMVNAGVVPFRYDELDFGNPTIQSDLPASGNAPDL